MAQEGISPAFPGVDGGGLPPSAPLRLRVVVDADAGMFLFEWSRIGSPDLTARGRLIPSELGLLSRTALDWVCESPAGLRHDSCSGLPASAHQLLRRIRSLFPVVGGAFETLLLADGRLVPQPSFPGAGVLCDEDRWKWLGAILERFAPYVESALAKGGRPAAIGPAALHLIVQQLGLVSRT